MKPMRDFKIKTKLWLLGVISIAGLLLIAAESFVAARKINQASTDISQIWLPSVIIAEELNTISSDYRLKETQFLTSTNEEEKGLIRSDLEQLSNRADRHFEDYDKIVNGNPKLEEAKTNWERYRQTSMSVLAADSALLDADGVLLQQSQLLFQETSVVFLEMADANKQGAQNASDHADQLYARLARIKLLTIAAVGLVIICLILWILHSIERPLEQVVDALWRASNGDLSIEIEYQSKDEMGLLTKSVNGLLKRLRLIIDDEKYLFREIGSENFEVKSTCEQAYQGDFAPILYAFTSLKSRLAEAKKKQTKSIEKREEQSDKKSVDGVREER